MSHTPKTHGYAHPRTNPNSRTNERRRQASWLLEVCRVEHPRDERGRCALKVTDR